MTTSSMNKQCVQNTWSVGGYPISFQVRRHLTVSNWRYCLHLEDSMSQALAECCGTQLEVGILVQWSNPWLYFYFSLLSTAVIKH